MKHVTVEFKDKFDGVVEGLTQWSYGHILRIIGLDLPDPVEIHFSLEEKNGEAPAQIGRTVDGVTEVEIPAFIMEGPAYIANDYYKAYAFIFVSDKDFGETVRKIEFNIRARSKPADWIPPEDKDMLGEILDAIREKVDKTGHAPNKILGTDEDGNIVTKEQEEYEKYKLPVASEAILGGVKPVTKTEDMTQDVGVDKHGKLFVKPCDTKMDEDVLLKLAIKPTTDPATSLHIQDSARYRVLDVSMSGKTEQYTTTGAQLANLPDCEEFTRGNITLSCKNGVIRVKGTSTNLVVTNLSDIGFDAKGMVGTYFISESGGHNDYVIVAVTKDGKTTWYSNKAFTLDGTESQVLVYCQIPANTTVYLELYPMLNPGTSAKPFEPYTGGIPTPNTEFEQPIVHAGRYNEETGKYEIDVEICNKNLWNGEILTSFFADTKGNMQSSEENRRKYRSLIMSMPQGSYTISTSEKCRYIRFLENNTLSFTTVANTNAYTFTTVGGVVGLSFRKEDNSDWDDSITIQVEYGTGETQYIQHKKQSITLSSDRPITKWDKLEKRDGVYGWVYKGVKHVLDGSMWLTYANFNGFTLPNRLSEKSNRREGYCNQAKVIPYNVNGDMKPSNGLWIGVSYNTALYLVNNDFFDATLEDKGLANFKAHLNENPLIIYTYTDTETFEPLQEAEQAALEALETYYGVTNISNSEECMMQIQYVADTKLYVDNKILAIQSAVI